MGGQTSYNLAPKIGRVGAIAESAEGIHAVARVANVAIPFGCMTVRDADDVLAKLPTSAAEVLAACQGSGGVAVATHAIITKDGSNDPTVPTFPQYKEFAQLKRGPVFVYVEEAVNQGDPVYIRFANAVATQNATYLSVQNANQKGAFRKSPDAAASTAQVTTVTPTAVNATIYAATIVIGGVTYAAEFLSDGSATATKIVTGLKAAFGTIPGISFSGTSTLIITSSVAGVPFTFTSVGDGVLAAAATTPNVTGAPTAALAPGMYYKTTAAAGSLAVVECNLGGS